MHKAKACLQHRLPVISASTSCQEFRERTIQKAISPHALAAERMRAYSLRLFWWAYPIAAVDYIGPVQPLRRQSLAMRMAVEHSMHHNDNH